MSSGETLTQITAIPLTRAAYERYGSVISADESMPFRPANMGTSKRFNHLCKLENLRQDKAKLNVCVFRCAPLKEIPLKMKLLEKHEYSTQVFMPMAEQGKYLAIVCLGGDKPDLSTLSAFVVDGPQGISYYPGVWHYPMTALHSQIDFSCLVFEDDTKDDCTVVNLDQPVLINV